MTTPTADVAITAVTALRASVDGEVLTPDDPGYDRARMGFNTRYAHHPELVVLPTSASDVVHAVRSAAAIGASVTIQSTGHGITREARNGMLFNLSRLNEVRVDATTGRAWIGGGATWQAVLDAATPHGLAPLLGTSPGVGAVGYTLGGGMGWLARRYGLAADSVRQFEIVTADGRLRVASAAEQPELFWALRGAGIGNLGVVTGMEMQLHPVRTVYAGNLLYPAEVATEVVERWHDWLPSVPDELTSAVTLMNFPPIEAVPGPLRGRSFAIVRGAFAGPDDAGERLLAYWRDWRTPELDAFGPLPFARIAEVSQDPRDPKPGVSRGTWLDGLPPTVTEAIVGGTFAGDGPPVLAFAEVRHAGGAIARVDVTETAYGNRDARIILNLAGASPNLEAVAAVHARIASIEAAVSRSATGGRYLNFLDGDARRVHARVGLAEGAVHRLARLKAELDPHDRFDHGLDLTAAIDDET